MMGSDHSPPPQASTGRLVRTPKEAQGERILAPTRRPDGTLRKPIRIRAGYTPQDEVAIYQSKGAIMRKGMQPDVPPGYDPPPDDRTQKTKSAKRNERKKEKKQQAALSSVVDKGKSLESEGDEARKTADYHFENRLEVVDSVIDQMESLTVSSVSSEVGSSADGTMDSSNPGSPGPDIVKKIRALKKKIRLAEAQLQGVVPSIKQDQFDKLARVEGWREELKLLENARK